ncbi:hypothetical protein VNO77_36553 [Canavalia gladiata]|uniref:Uncharacterized protein n=1 Tax=Canavalia gladiata TaxID=3824 RepID=A0AAN9PUD7_CANGL
MRLIAESYLPTSKIGIHVDYPNLGTPKEKIFQYLLDTDVLAGDNNNDRVCLYFVGLTRMNGLNSSSTKPKNAQAHHCLMKADKEMMLRKIQNVKTHITCS